MSHDKKTDVSVNQNYGLYPPAGNALEVISPFLLTAPSIVQPLCRVSSSQQGKNKNLLGQEMNLSRLVNENHCTLLPPIKYEWSGKGTEWLEILHEISLQAQKDGAILLAATTDRFIRSEHFRSNHPLLCQAQASTVELQNLRQAVGNSNLMTFLHPNASSQESRSLLIRWGQAVKNTPSGFKKRRKEELQPIVRKLYQEGMGYQRISKLVKVPRMTAVEWVKELDREIGRVVGGE